jgi:hypothetical protein
MDSDKIYGKVCKCAVEKGLQLCPPEVGPQFCLQLERGAVTRTEYVVGMKPIRTLDGFSRVFTVELRRGQRQLNSYDCYGYGDYLPHDNKKRYLFINPRTS